METRVQAMIKLIDEDGDSFAKRAEMYYKRRPELIHFVEEFFRAYKALADRYDHISGELHNARSTIATAFPDKVSVEHTEDHSKGKVDPGDDLAGFSNALSNKPPPPPPPSLEKKPLSNTPKVEMTDLSNYEHAMDVKTAQKEIDKLQKEILALIMEKEFIKSSYEAGLAKYWEIEKQILELQATVCFLQEEHGLSSSIEADEEQTIMAVTALNSCEQMLGNLQEEQLKVKAEAKIESQRIMIMEEKLKLLKDEFLKRHPEEQKLDAHPTIKTLEEEVCNLRKEKTEYQEMCHKIVKHLEIDANDSLSLPEYSHLIDELVTKVVDLETEVSTQNVQMMRMKSEADHLQEHLQSLQEDKMLLLDDSKTMSERIKDLEEELYGIQHLNLHIEEQKSQLEAELTEACSKLEGLTEKLKFRQDHGEGKISASLESGSESTVKLSQEKNANETSSGHQNQKDGEDSASVQSGVESAFGLPQEKSSNETSAGDQNYEERESSALVQSASGSSDEFLQEKDVEGTSAGNQIHDECENLFVDKKGVNETSAILDSHDECERSALVQSGRESALHFPGEKHADETSSSHNNHIEGEHPALVQPGTKSVVQVPGRKYGNETLPIEAREEKDVMVESQDERDLKGGAQAEESNLKTGKLNSGFYEGELQRETNSEFHYEAKYLMQQETDNQSKSTANDDHEVKQGVESGTDHQSTSIDNALEKLSLELVDAQSWQTFLEGMEDREKTLLSEYTSILRTYRETKRKLSDLEKQNQDLVAEKTEKIRLLQMESAQKDGEIQSLKQQLGILQVDYEDQDRKSIQGKYFELKPSRSDDSNALLVLDESDHENVRDPEDHSARRGIDPLPTEKEIKVLFSQNTSPPSAMEEKFRREIDSLLEENLEFWLRFSASFHQIQKFQTTVQEAQVELLKLKKEKTNDEGTNSSTTTTSSTKDNESMKTNVELIQKQLTELQGELIIWLEQNAMLKEELKHRSSSLSDIQEELTKVSKVKSKNGEAELTVYQAAKFQGEVSNMQQENNKVADELQAGLDHVRGLQLELEKELVKLKENFGLQESKRHHHHYYQLSYVRNTLSRRVPLRSILTFAGKPPKRPSLFSCVNPALQKQYSDLRASGLQK